MNDTTPAFDDFWSASELSELTRGRFAEQMASFTPDPAATDPWSRTARPVSADKLTGPLAGQLASRRSVRRFAGSAITDDQLGRLLSALAGPVTDRGYPSAGGLYPVRAITLRFTEDRIRGEVLQHDPDRHKITTVGDCPGWNELIDDLAGQDAETAPAAIVGLYADTSQMLRKYGERGGRFVLLEAGAMLQNLALAAAALGLVGYPMGGSSDARMLDLVGLSGRSARFVINYAVGHPG
jgi:SagB-type dehydrogenase family enzyme